MCADLPFLLLRFKGVSDGFMMDFFLGITHPKCRSRIRTLGVGYPLEKILYLKDKNKPDVKKRHLFLQLAFFAGSIKKPDISRYQARTLVRGLTYSW